MAIHKNTELSKAEKFNYLKSYLSGAAANVIAGLALTDANFDSAETTQSESSKDIL